MTAYRVRGTTDDVTACGWCGREDLKSTVIMEVLDADGSTGDVIYAGSDCAATLAGRTQKAIRSESRRAGEAARREREQAKRAESTAQTAVFLAWVAGTYGVTVTQPAELWAHEKALGMTPYQARKAWKAAA